MNEDHKNPSIFTSLYWMTQDKIIQPDFLLNLLGFFWPVFEVKGGYVFLRETFSQDEYDRLVKESFNPEYWINLVTIDELFSELPDWEEKSKTLARALVSMWRAKLKIDFPDLDFTVTYLHSEEDGDCGLTFYQTDENSARKRKL